MASPGFLIPSSAFESRREHHGLHHNMGYNPPFLLSQDQGHSGFWKKHEILKSLSVLTKCEEDYEDLTFSFGFKVSYYLINHFNATIRCFLPVIISKVSHFIIGFFIWEGCY